jgi:hypothetical protein
MSTIEAGDLPSFCARSLATVSSTFELLKLPGEYTIRLKINVAQQFFGAVIMHVQN